MVPDPVCEGRTPGASDGPSAMPSCADPRRVERSVSWHSRSPLNLILLEPGEIAVDGAVSLRGARAEHIIQVLQAMPGDTVRLGVLGGGMGAGRVTAIVDRRVELTCELEATIPPRPPVDLLMAVPRPKVMRRLWAQIAALGVGQIILTNASRVERNYFDTHVLGEACYRPLLIEGLQQARDTHMPDVRIRRQLKVLVEDELDALFPKELRVTAHPGVGRPLTATIRARATRRVMVAVGPEGGWTPFELDLLTAHGFQTADAGPRVLRSDTACIAILALAHEALRTGSPSPE
jgi:RsmE family RNA methyltransferase